MDQQDLAGIPPAIAPEPSVADLIRGDLARAHTKRQQDIQFPGTNLWVTFRPLNDYGELQQVLDPRHLAHLPESEQEVQMAINTLVAASVGSYAMIDGVKHDVGLPLGMALYDFVYPPDGEVGGVRPATDGEAIAALFEGDTIALVFFARQLEVWRKMQAMLVEAEPGK